MLEITIDKTKATPEEIAALEATDGYEVLISKLTKSGRQLGVSLTIKEPLPSGGAFWFTNTLDGQLSGIAGPSGSAKSLLQG